MTQAGKAVHHHHVRQRVYVKKEKYPHPDKWKRRMDEAVIFVAIIGAVMTIPQVLTIWMGGDAAGVSILAWGTYLLGAVVWLLYALLHDEKPMIIRNSMMIVMHMLIIVGVIIYG
ncbi:hypothetical protein ACFL0V_03565 [Nanoarchaeota archaeon]